MDKWQAWLGLAGICFLIFDRISGGFGWLFGRTHAETSLKRDIEELQKDFAERRLWWDTEMMRLHGKASDRNDELQRMLGNMELKMLGLQKDCDRIKEDITHLRQRRS